MGSEGDREFTGVCVRAGLSGNSSSGGSFESDIIVNITSIMDSAGLLTQLYRSELIKLFSPAEDPADYEQLTSMVTFTSGDSIGDTKCITFDLKNDTLLEGDETFAVVIDSSPTQGAISQATVTIMDEDRMLPLGACMLFISK